MCDEDIHVVSLQSPTRMEQIAQRFERSRVTISQFNLEFPSWYTSEYSTRLQNENDSNGVSVMDIEESFQ